MQEVLNFLGDCKTFFLATTENDQPRVRPLGFVMEFDGKLSFCTASPKDMSNQMKANPKVEVCGCNAEAKWVRICGNAVFNSTPEAKKKALEVMPALAQVYPDQSIFEIFYIDNAVATFADMQGGKKVVKL